MVCIDRKNGLFVQVQSNAPGTHSTSAKVSTLTQIIQNKKLFDIPNFGTRGKY